jgi:hypothetical protein
MPTKFNMTKDIAGYNGFGVIQSQDIYSGVMATSVAQSVTVPSEYKNYLAILSYTPGANVFVSVNDTAIVPGGALAASNSELNPAGRKVLAGDVISLITPDTAGAYVSVCFYVVDEYVN